VIRESNEKTELQPETLEYVKTSDPAHRKKMGQFFTPRSIRKQLMSHLPKRENPKVIDPACGTGEFLLSAQEYFEDPELYGWEIDERPAEIARRLVPGANIEMTDALRKEYREEFDYVIGNPPYYEFRPEEGVRSKFSEIIGGRSNIYALFVFLGVRLLRDGGYLAYVISPSMNNGAYFSKLRRFILRNANIEHMAVLPSPRVFEDALQSVMFLILKKGPNNGDYVFARNGISIFSEKVNLLEKEFAGKTTLRELGYRVTTGRVVWNQNKHLLTHQRRGNVPLIWSYNITSSGLKLGIGKKPQYIRTDHYDLGPAIVVNRIVGHPGSGAIRAVLIPRNMKFVGENHVNVIFPPDKTSMTQLEDISEQLNSPEKQVIVRNVTGNTQISRNELEKLFPIDARGINKQTTSDRLHQIRSGKGSLSLGIRSSSETRL
jgi:adenine-specific DNA-methyltransferase